MRKLLTVLLALSAFAAASAQSYSYTVLSPDEGFPASVNSIFIEEAGFAWLGAEDALYLLYGNKAYSRHDVSEGYLPGNNIYQVCTDTHGVAWILTNNGFLGYDSRTDIAHPSIKGMDSRQTAYCALPHENMVYFGGTGRIWQYSYETGEFSTLCELDNDFRVTDLIIGSKGGNKNIIALSKGSRDFISVDAEDGDIISSSSLESGFCAGFTDSRGNIWVSLFDRGVLRLSPELEAVRHYDSTNSRLSEDNVLCFAERYGKIWMGTDGGGINILDPWNENIHTLNLAAHPSAQDPVTTVSTMFCDHNGHVWCGRPHGGILIISETDLEMFRTEDFFPPIDPKGISYFYNDGSDDRVWIGTHGSGLLRYDPATGLFTHYPSTEGLHVYSMAKLDDNRIALSCPNKGFFDFNKTTGEIKRFGPLSDLKYYYATAGDGVYIENDAHGNILFFAHDIMRWNKNESTIETFRPEHNANEGYLHPVRGSMCQYILDYTHIFKWNESLPGKLEVVGEITDGSRFYCSTVTKDGIIWLGAGKNIYRFDTETRELTVGGHDFEEFPTLLFCADNGNLWIGSRNALYVQNPVNNSIATLSEVDGVANNEYVHQAKLQAPDGDIYLGGARGMVRIHSSFSLPHSVDPEIVVSGVTVDGEEVFDFKDLDVPWSHSTMTIRFLVRGTDILSTNMYRISEQGPNGKVTSEESNKPFINFRGLSPGRHSISVATTTRDGRWTEPKQVFSFRVNRPWYGTLWAILMYVGLICLLIWYFMKSLAARRAEMREKETDEERYNFLINVSHELRTPLTLILGPLKRIIGDPELKETYRESIKKVCRQADRMATLLNTVLTTNKIENGATQVHPRPVLVNDTVKRWADEFTDEADGRGMSIMMKTDPGAGSAMMDPDLCRIVFSNIMSNALRHNNPGHHITVCTSADRTPGFVRIGIRDHGSGIGIVDVSKLFERYYRATEEHTGFGIGLSYAKTIIDAHGGKIGAFNNNEDPGATFWFELPVAATPGESLADTPEYVSKLTKSILAKDLKDKTILFVDDNKDLRDYVEGELRGLCKKLLLAYNGAEALRVLVNHEVDAVVTDVMMPEIDGIELCRTIKSSPVYRHIPVILLSARVDEESKSRGYAVNADHYLSKPFDIKDLVAVLDNKTKK